MWCKRVILLLSLIGISFGFDNTFESYGEFLKRYVCKGGVAYGQLGSDPIVNEVSKEFSSLTEVEFKAMKVNSQVAFLINAYNFFTIVLIKDNYPLKNGIKDIKNPWDKKFIDLFGKKVSLNHIEHNLLRKQFDEPRIHFALVCASKGCPELVNEAYTGRSLSWQLDQAAKKFLSDRDKNYQENGKLYLSQIFKWYGKDFNKRHGGYVNYVNKVLGITDKQKVKFLEYSWKLNEVFNCSD